MSEAKPFDIPKALLKEAWRRVMAHEGAAGIDGQTFDEFEADLSRNFYRIWNRMSRLRRSPAESGHRGRVLGATGLGVKMTSAILSLSNGQLWPALLLTAHACLVLGMEVPITAAYVICVSVAVIGRAALAVRLGLVGVGPVLLFGPVVL